MLEHLSFLEKLLSRASFLAPYGGFSSWPVATTIFWIVYRDSLDTNSICLQVYVSFFKILLSPECIVPCEQSHGIHKLFQTTWHVLLGQSDFFQLPPIPHFQSHFHIFRYLFQQCPVVSTKICASFCYGLTMSLSPRRNPNKPNSGCFQLTFKNC